MEFSRDRVTSTTATKQEGELLDRVHLKDTVLASIDLMSYAKNWYEIIKPTKQFQSLGSLFSYFLKRVRKPIPVTIGISNKSSETAVIWVCSASVVDFKQLQDNDPNLFLALLETRLLILDSLLVWRKESEDIENEARGHKKLYQKIKKQTFRYDKELYLAIAEHIDNLRNMEKGVSPDSFEKQLLEDQISDLHVAYYSLTGKQYMETA